MDATIVAALISGSVGVIGIVGTVVTSVVGSKNTRKATERTIEAGTAANRATLLAAHDAWLREKRAAAYVEMLVMLLHRRAKRSYDVATIEAVDDDFPRDVDDEATESDLNKFYSEYKLPGTFETESRLVAYASDAVMAAYEATRYADLGTVARWIHFRRLVDQRNSAQPPDLDMYEAADKELKASLKAANAADDALIKVIRDELRSWPEAAMVPVALPAVRRRSWLRRKAVDD